jgi:putative PIN family toxin of toxin-antitoxin system
LVTHAQVLVSDHTLAELADGLSHSKFDPYVSLDDRKEIFRRFARLAEIVTVTSTVRACRDAKDDKFLELAVDGAARFIVTGDKDLLTLSPFRAVVILNPAQAMELPASALTDAVGPGGQVPWRDHAGGVNAAETQDQGGGGQYRSAEGRSHGEGPSCDSAVLAVR